ncbi:MAG: hypothetical protein A3D19_02650 [Deltaproteobacteria bacterium RIFCSPHIGHO2_02_FULL_38_15]|nr:MAG: hypothetical protein A3D19_02650 [Deltaproteobacteria bacterium RIFCSPHIGHO2_02_FULL_38_15]HIH23290.1 hypothetical protein [Candidatus Micrarchaeota archaeon]
MEYPRITRVMLLFSIVAVLLIFGCISEKTASESKKEILLSSNSYDIEGDFYQDVLTYSFTAYRLKDTDITVKRSIVAVPVYKLDTSQLKELTSGDADKIDSLFENFIKEKADADKECGGAIGLSGVRCLDETTCSKLCSSSSQKCKKLTEDYPDLLGHFILSYVKANNGIYDATVSIQNKISSLKDADTADSKKSDIVSRVLEIESFVAALNANPLSQSDMFGLCDMGTYGTDNLREILDKMVAYSTKPVSYHYFVFIELSRAGDVKNGVYSDLIVKDVVTPSLAALSSEFVSPQQIKSEKGEISWPTIKPYVNKKSILFYEFTSSMAPSDVVERWDRPVVVIKSISTDALKPTIVIFDLFHSFTKNYFISMGAATALTIIIILFLYSMALVAFNLMKARSQHENNTAAFKRVIGKTEMRWKTDAGLGVLLFVVGIGIALFLAKTGDSEFDILRFIPLVFEDYYGFGAWFGIAAGLLLLYSSADNFVRIYALERIYGQAIKEEKDIFAANVTQLKSKIGELKALVDQLGKDGFEVGEEYDLLSTISLQHIDTLLSKADNYAKKTIAEMLEKVESAIESLHEKKRVSEESWPKWSDNITALLRDKNEAYASNLLTIPSSLRLWALSRYAKEHEDLGFSFEGNVIKKKVMSAEAATKLLLDKNLMRGVAVVKSGKLTAVQVADGGSGTVFGVLAVKLLSYLRTLSQKMHMHEYGSVAVVGGKVVLALIKYRDVESVVVVERAKFKEAVDDWKNKIKNL